MSDCGFTRISEAGGISGSHFCLDFVFLFFSETKRNTGGSLTQILQRNNNAVAANREHRDFHHHLDKNKQFFRFGIMASMKQFILFYLSENLWTFSSRKHQLK